MKRHSRRRIQTGRRQRGFASGLAVGLPPAADEMEVESGLAHSAHNPESAASLWLAGLGHQHDRIIGEMGQAHFNSELSGMI